jgi:hypothetical protein
VIPGTPSRGERTPNAGEPLEEKLSSVLGVMAPPPVSAAADAKSLCPRSLPFASRSRLKLNVPSTNVPSVWSKSVKGDCTGKREGSETETDGCDDAVGGAFEVDPISSSPVAFEPTAEALPLCAALGVAADSEDSLERTGKEPEVDATDADGRT